MAAMKVASQRPPPQNDDKELTLLQGQGFDWKARVATRRKYALHPLAVEFAAGTTGRKPAPELVAIVDRIITTVLEKTTEAEYSVDEDGALSFEALLTNGNFIMCEVSIAGQIHTGIYQGVDGDLIRFHPHQTEQQLLNLF